MTPCIIESPYAGEVRRNSEYLQTCIRWCILHGWTPYASHQMLTEALDDNDPEQRALGLMAGIAMSHALAAAGAPWLFFVDRGVSSGMQAAIEEAASQNRDMYAVSILPRVTPNAAPVVRRKSFCGLPLLEGARTNDRGVYESFTRFFTFDGGWVGSPPNGWRP